MTTGKRFDKQLKIAQDLIMARYEMYESKVGEIIERNGSFVTHREYFRGHWSGDIKGSVRHLQGLSGPETEVVTSGIEGFTEIRVMPLGVDGRIQELKDKQLQPISANNS